MPQPTVLIADDDPNFRYILKIRLQSLGYRVLESWDGVGALAKTRSDNVDALILDHEMPAGSGRAVAEQLRGVTGAPIVFLSAHGPDRFRDLILTLPETYYLPKPLDSGKLARLLGQLFPNTDAPRKPGPSPDAASPG